MRDRIFKLIFSISICVPCLFIFLFMFDFIGPSYGIIVDKYQIAESDKMILTLGREIYYSEENAGRQGNYFVIKTSWGYTTTKRIFFDVNNRLYNKYKVGDKIQFNR